MIVTCNPYFNCGQCYSCAYGTVNACMDDQTMGCQRDGAFQEYITMPIERVYDGTMEIEIYPDSRLRDKSSLIDSMLLGENVCTLADGAFYADYGVPDFGIMFGLFLFDRWDQCWTLIESDRYKGQCAKLEEKGLKILVSN